MTRELFLVRAPTKWATPPDTFSHSSLSAIEVCPRRWQLGRSEFGELGRIPERPNRAAVAGTIVHELLDALYKWLAVRGAPALGSSELAEHLREFDLRGRARPMVDVQRAAWRAHPRAGAWALGLTPEVVVNRVVRMFRNEYAQAQRVEPAVTAPTRQGRGRSTSDLAALVARAPLSELTLRHPSLPFEGTLDLVRQTSAGVTILDFKTGAPKPEHQAQLLCYAVLWWRNARVEPVELVASYPSASQRFECGRARLEEAERELGARIADARRRLSTTPADATTGPHCRYCSFRPFCDDAWADAPSMSATGRLDVELVVEGPPAAYGFTARTNDGEAITVVHDAHVSLRDGERLRLLDAKWDASTRELRLDGASEVFYCAREGDRSA
ncbi:MAG: PD-(D/E)XK nuclease family protein [Sandaracinaceae bacterium]|nr:PD-(D/E)XK nuclease family protein [Sandaracinaceae bacterium]